MTNQISEGNYSLDPHGVLYKKIKDPWKRIQITDSA